jgi:predicted TPR repeat methyltransferase
MRADIAGITDAHHMPAAHALMARAQRLIDDGRIGVAAPLIAALARMGAPPAALAHLQARAALLEGRTEAARAILDAALAAAPADIALRLCRAAARAADDLLAEAAQDAAEAVVTAPHDPHPKALLGTILLALGHAADAVACLGEALAATPRNTGYRSALAVAHMRAGDHAAADAVLDAGLAAAPADIALYRAAILAALRRGDSARAHTLAEAAIAAGAIDAGLMGLAGHALAALGRHAEGAEAFREGMRLAPDDAAVRHLVAASGARPGGERAPPAYIRALHDHEAQDDENRAIAGGYRVPGLFRARLQAWAVHAGPQAGGTALDLGCGSGLVAVALTDMGLPPMVGVDLSPAMLAQARAKGLYAELLAADLLAFLAQDERRHALVLAADVLGAFGDLAPVLTGIAARLSPAGRCLLSLEHLTETNAPWRLGRTGRFAHTEDHLRATAARAGLTVEAIAHETLRWEADHPVPGLIAALTR